MAEEAVNTAKAAAKAAKAEEEAAKAEEKAARAAMEAAKEKKARDEAAAAVKEELRRSDRDVAEKAIEKGLEKGAEGVPTTNAEKLPALVGYLFAIPVIMLGAILFFANVILLLEPRYKTDAEKREKAGAKFITTGERPGVWLKS